MATRSALSAVQLQLAYTSLLRLRKAIDDSRYDSDLHGQMPALELRHADRALRRLKAALTDTREARGFEYGLDAMIASVEAELGGAQSLNDVDTPANALAHLDIACTGCLYLKPGAWARAAASASRGADDALWSSANLYRHLDMVERSVEAESARPWIEALLFRTAAMLPDGRYMCLHVPNTLPSSFGRGARDRATYLSSFPGYIAAVIRAPHHPISWPTWEVLKLYARSAVFILEAKLSVDQTTVEIHNAVCELYVCGRQLCQKVVRGALCNGHEWIFLVLKFNDTGEGASYKDSSVIDLGRDMAILGPDVLPVISPPSADVIAGILLHWITNGFLDIGEDDLFEQRAWNRVI